MCTHSKILHPPPSRHTYSVHSSPKIQISPYVCISEEEGVKSHISKLHKLLLSLYSTHILRGNKIPSGCYNENLLFIWKMYRTNMDVL